MRLVIEYHWKGNAAGDSQEFTGMIHSPCVPREGESIFISATPVGDSELPDAKVQSVAYRNNGSNLAFVPEIDCTITVGGDTEEESLGWIREEVAPALLKLGFQEGFH